MSINIGINGFGRIGRLVFRSAINDNNFKVISINDLLDIEQNTMQHIKQGLDMLITESKEIPFEGQLFRDLQ